MTFKATLLASALPQFCPTTNHYQGSDGRYLLVTLPTMDVVGTLSALGFRIPVVKSHLPTKVDVFLSNENQEVVDADGDPSNGMTPIGSFEVSTHEAALSAMGYELAT